jgi:hypothetical protein
MPKGNLKTLLGFLEQQALIHGPLGKFYHVPLRKADDFLGRTDFFTAVYGEKVWDTLQSQTRFWNMIRRVPWGPRTGWRNRDQRNASTKPIVGSGTLPDIAKANYRNIEALPKSIVTMLGVDHEAQFLSGLEGGIGDALSQEQNWAEIDHVKDVNQQLLASAHSVVTTGGASGVAAVKPFDNLRVGDTIYEANMGGTNTTAVITEISAAGVLTYTPAGTGDDMVDGNMVHVKARAGFTSLDDVIEVDGRTYVGANSDDADCYNLTTRTADTYAAATVLDNDGTARDISTDLLDEAIREVRLNGGEPDLIVTGLEQVDNIAALLQAQQRFMDSGEFRVKVGTEETLPGFRTGFNLATYKGIPVFGDPDCSKSFTEPGVDIGSNVYVLDTRFIEIAVAQMTRYFESRDFLQNNALVYEGMFWTMAELRVVDITKQAKIVDLNATVTV